ncbi:isopentenyl-diphosphate delta-isomerase [Burkholderia singularis]|nr:isopentenyl-diphosphate delta-isomerase [Burkholderia sp. Bp7605]
MEERLILVNPDDTPIGICSKTQVHQQGLLHRAFSIFVFDGADCRLLLQQRAPGKYHSGGLWTNSCCGHPRPGETMSNATRRRLAEEMGFVCDLHKVDTLHYRAPLSNGLIEHEFVHIHAGMFDGTPQPDPAEAEDWRWVEILALFAWVDADPDAFTVWFRQMIERAGPSGLQAWARQAAAIARTASVS